MKTYFIDSFANTINQSYGINTYMAVISIIAILVFVLLFISIFVMLAVYFERKIAAAFQCRLGPTRVGFKGILQSIADVLKLFLKEKNTPLFSDKLLHFIAPILCLSSSFMAILIIPFSSSIQIINIDTGILFWSAITSLGILGMLIAGWSSYNKWSFLGAIRSASQLISYELSIVLSIIVIIIFTGSLNLQKIVLSQLDGCWIWRGHIVTLISFCVFFIASIAELNRAPFDLPEGESELGAGFHTEYSGMQFAFFFLAEYINLFLSSSIIVVLFFGGWLPIYIYGFDQFNIIMSNIPSLIWFFIKVFIMIFIIMWIRWTLPRLRIDQLIKLEWTFLLPVNLLIIMVASILVLYNLHL